MSNSTIFSGNSRFATDFQAIIDRSVAIASLPLQQLNNFRSKLNDQSSALSSLDSKFSALQTAIQSLQTVSSGNAFTASVSNPSVLSATVGAGASAGSYGIEVTNLGSFTSTLSMNGLLTVTDPTSQSISNSASFTLTVNGTNFTVTPSAKTLNALVQAINNTTGANVQASIVNVGSSSNDYRLAIQSTKLNPDTIQLNDGSANLLNTLATGTQATYKINGSTPFSSTSRTVNLAPGLTVQLLQQSTPGVATTVTVGQDPSGLSNALTSFANAYNGVVDELNKERGTSAGPLAGQGLVNYLTQALHQIASYSSGSGSVSSLTSLGLQSDANGKLSLNPTAFSSATSGGLAAALSFLGSATGGGFLQSATNGINSVEDPTSGLVKTAITSVQNQETHEDQLIADNQARIDQIRNNLAHQMATADALIASMEERVTFMTNLFQTEQVNAQTLR